MSWVSKGLKKVGKGIKQVGKAAGKAWEAVDDFALPAVGFALGGPAGAALGAAAARGIGDGKFDPKATALAGAKGYIGGQLAGTAGLKGGQGLKVLGSSAKTALSNPMATAGNVLRSQVPGAGAAPGVTQGAAGGGSIGGGALKMVGGVPGLVDLGLGAYSAYQGHKDGQRADKLQQQALDLAMARDAELAPMRAAGIQRLMGAQRPDLSGDFQSANAFSRPLKRVG